MAKKRKDGKKSLPKMPKVKTLKSLEKHKKAVEKVIKHNKEVDDNKKKLETLKAQVTKIREKK